MTSTRRELFLRKCLFFLRVLRRKPELVSAKAQELHESYALQILRDPEADSNELMMAAGLHRVIAISEGLMEEPEQQGCIACQEYFLAVNVRQANDLPVPAELHEYKKRIECKNECRHNPDPFRRPSATTTVSQYDPDVHYTPIDAS
jgi:hypothetical protein